MKAQKGNPLGQLFLDGIITEKMKEKFPDLLDNFPKVDPMLKISSDLRNKKHGPHYDVFEAISGGTDQVRISPSGDIIGGTTNIGSFKMNWGDEKKVDPMIELSNKLMERGRKEEEAKRKTDELIKKFTNYPVKGFSAANESVFEIPKPLPLPEVDFKEILDLSGFSKPVRDIIENISIKNAFNTPSRLEIIPEPKKSWEMPKLPSLPKHFSFGDSSDKEAAERKTGWRIMDNFIKTAPSGYENTQMSYTPQEGWKPVEFPEYKNFECGSFKITPKFAPGFGPVNAVSSSGVIIPK